MKNIAKGNFMKRAMMVSLFCLMITVACNAVAWRSSYRAERLDNLSPQLKSLLEGLLDQPNYTYYYDPAYVQLSYPGGDVPKDRGVCSDVVVRAFRNAGIDLQKEVHEDMKQNFSAYPNRWGLKAPDANIDHRRVANLMKYFERKGKAQPITQDAKDYLPGDIVAWRFENNLLHIGMVSNLRAANNTYCIIHNVGAGAKVENRLFEWQIIGHYRYFENTKQK
jgi:uncharacterized protein YijF (DUF1287 family)